MQLTVKFQTFFLCFELLRPNISEELKFHRSAPYQDHHVQDIKFKNLQNQKIKIN